MYLERYKNSYDAYISLVWLILLTAAVVCLSCRVAMQTFNWRHAAFANTGFIPVATAFNLDEALDQKLNVFLATVGAICTIAFIIFLSIILYKLRKWRNRKYTLQCVKSQDQVEEAYQIASAPGQSDSRFLSPKGRMSEQEMRMLGRPHGTYPTLSS